DVIDPGSNRLTDQNATVVKRCRTVHGAQRARWCMHAAPVRTYLADDPPGGGDEEHAAVVRISDRPQPVREEVRVIGRVQVARRDAADVWVPVAPEKAATGEGDDLDRVLVLLVADDAGEAGAEERIVVEPKRHRQALVAPRIGPEDPLARVHEQHSIV